MEKLSKINIYKQIVAKPVHSKCWFMLQNKNYFQHHSALHKMPFAKYPAFQESGAAFFLNIHSY